jgi:predicted nuclease with TOPRIM domain
LAPSQSGVRAALANLTAVVTAARQQGSADQQAEDLLHQAEELAKALQERHKQGKGEEAHNKLAELQRKVEELIREGKVRPPATTQLRQAIAELAQAVQQLG